MAQESNYINAISKLFHIPKSTLRYWDSEGLIHFDRDCSNYRRYSVKSVMDICDIAFYRGMNIPITELKRIHEMSADELEQVTDKSKEKMEDQILALRKVSDKLETRLERFRQYKQLLQRPYVIEKPGIQKVIANDPMNPEHAARYIADPYNAVVFFSARENHGYTFGLTANGDDRDANLIWEDDNPDIKYVHCLLKVCYTEQDGSCFDEHREYFREHGYSMGDAIGRYLFTAADDKLYDYLEAWIGIA